MLAVTGVVPETLPPFDGAVMETVGVVRPVEPPATKALSAKNCPLAGIPATSRETNHAVVLAAGHRAEDGRSAADWAALAKLGQPIVLYMPMAQLAGIAAALEQGGLSADTPAALIQSATTAQERVVESRLGSLAADAAKHGIGSPSIVVIGAIAGLRRQLLSSLVPL